MQEDASRHRRRAPTVGALPCREPSETVLADGGLGPGPPAWLTGEDPVGGPPDRQVLVVGTTVPGLALTLLLRRAGYDPILVGSGSVGSRLSVLWPPAIDLLDRFGAGGVVRGAAVPVETVTLDGAGTADTRRPSLPDRTAAPLLVRRRALREGLRACLRGTDPRDRTVVGVDQRASAVEVVFADGVREPFDLVVDAGASRPLVDPPDEPTTPCVRQFEATVPADAPMPAHPVEHHAEQVTQVLPAPPDGDGPGGGLLRVTVAPEDRAGVGDHTGPSNAAGGEPKHEESAASSALRRLFPQDWAAVPDGLLPAVLAEGSIRRTAHAQSGLGPTGDDPGHDRIVRCGAAAASVAPATGLSAALGIEDAWVLAEELATGPSSVAGTSRRYAGRRRRRGEALRGAATTWVDRQGSGATGAGGAPTATGGDGPLAAVSGFRAVALGSLLGPPLSTVQRDGPGGY
jgi:2-polyprenyl-6-methoxyphenol hydroxylase-like FAD-dependent oxidoreductase